MYLFLFNPSANKGKGKKMEGKIKKYLNSLDIRGRFVKCEKEGDAIKITNQAIENNIKDIVAIGGDGFINQIVQVIADRNISLGIIPIGNANFLANILGINSWKKGCEILTKKDVVNINLGLIKNRFFSSSVEIESSDEKEYGVFKKILHRKKNKKYIPLKIQVQDDRTKLKIQANVSSLIVSTIPFPPPKNFNIRNNDDDHSLNIIIKSKTISEKNKNQEEITILRGSKIEIESKNPIKVKTDGEYCGKTPVTIELVPQSLRVIVPPKK